MSDLIIREVVENVWIFSRPFSRFGVLPIGGRSTAIKLRGGGVWILASTALDDETKEKLAELGPVKYICTGDSEHFLYLAAYKGFYKDAKLYTVEDALPKLPSDLEYAGVWGRDPPDTKYEFEDEVQVVYFPGHQHKEVAYFHADSKSLIEADLVYNLPAKEQYSKTQMGLFGASNFHPYSWAHATVIRRQIENYYEMDRDVRKVSALDFERIIPCHGDLIEKDAKKAWNKAYDEILNPSPKTKKKIEAAAAAAGVTLPAEASGSEAGGAAATTSGPSGASGADAATGATEATASAKEATGVPEATGTTTTGVTEAVQPADATGVPEGAGTTTEATEAVKSAESTDAAEATSPPQPAGETEPTSESKAP